jgi:Zn finger protein HypA/HybF involved in hydrogenase expression
MQFLMKLSLIKITKQKYLYMSEVKTWCTHCKSYSSFDIPEGTSAEQALGQPCPNCGTRGRLTRVEE